MKRITEVCAAGLMALALSLALAGPAGAAPPSNDSQALLKQQMREFEAAVDSTLRQMFSDSRPFTVLEQPKATYLDGFGIVVHAEINLYPTSANLMPFMTGQSLDRELKNEREQKQVRLRQLQARLQSLLLEQSGPLSQLRDGESMAVVIHLFNPRPFPEIPGQIVVQARRQALLALQVQGRKIEPEDLAKTVSLREF